jgi:hypothetical protein
VKILLHLLQARSVGLQLQLPLPELARGVGQLLLRCLRDATLAPQLLGQRRRLGSPVAFQLLLQQTTCG